MVWFPSFQINFYWKMQDKGKWRLLELRLVWKICRYSVLKKKKLQNACFDWAFYSQDLYSNSPYCLPYNSCDIGWENLVLDQLIIPRLIFVFILITCLHDIVSILQGEILSWSLMGVKGLKKLYFILLLSVVLQMLDQYQCLRNCTPTPPLIQH